MARPSSTSLLSYLPAPTALRQTFTIGLQKNNPPPSEVVRLKTALSDVLHAIGGVTFHLVCKGFRDPADEALWKYDVTANENTWSRAARRKRKRSISPSSGRVKKIPRLDRTEPQIPIRLRGENAYAPDLPHHPALQCWISVLDSPSKYSYTHYNQRSLTLEAQWRRGKDRGMFESFWSHVCRKVIDKLERPVTEDGDTPTA